MHAAISYFFTETVKMNAVEKNVHVDVSVRKYCPIYVFIHVNLIFVFIFMEDKMEENMNMSQNCLAHGQKIEVVFLPRAGVI